MVNHDEMSNLRELSRTTIWSMDDLDLAAKMLESRGQNYSTKAIDYYCHFAAKCNMNLHDAIRAVGALLYLSADMKKIIITENEVNITGFSANDFIGDAKKEFGSCRDVARVGLAWAAKRIAEELHKDLTGEWDKQTTCIGD